MRITEYVVLNVSLTTELPAPSVADCRRVTSNASYLRFSGFMRIMYKTRKKVFTVNFNSMQFLHKVTMN